jgi:hypothetical protein
MDATVMPWKEREEVGRMTAKDQGKAMVLLLLEDGRIARSAQFAKHET